MYIYIYIYIYAYDNVYVYGYIFVHVHVDLDEDVSFHVCDNVCVNVFASVCIILSSCPSPVPSLAFCVGSNDQ